jgi:hypothetical protein
MFRYNGKGNRSQDIQNIWNCALLLIIMNRGAKSVGRKIVGGFHDRPTIKRIKETKILN